MSRESLPAVYFETLYREDPDPWRFASSDYEREKYAATLATLPRAGYRRGLEIGCSIGVLTRDLATRCERLLAIDCVDSALDEARRRCADRPGVTFAQMELPRTLPAGSFDLLVLSEVVYYWNPEDLRRIATFTAHAIEPGADIVLVHWTGATNYPLSGDAAAGLFIEATAPFTTLVLQQRADSYRIDVLRRLDREAAAA